MHEMLETKRMSKEVLLEALEINLISAYDVACIGGNEHDLLRNAIKSINIKTLQKGKSGIVKRLNSFLSQYQKQVKQHHKDAKRAIWLLQQLIARVDFFL